MQTNLSLTANFVPNPFPAVRGVYSGLMANAHGVLPDNSGYFSVALTSLGRFSGHLLCGGKRFGFSGRFDLSGAATLNVRRANAGPLTVTLHTDLAHTTDQVTGSVTDGYWSSDLTADRNVFNGLLNPAQQAGLRSFVLEKTPDKDRKSVV